MGMVLRSPQEIYDDPKLFGGVLSAGLNERGEFDPSYPRSVHGLLCKLFSDWPQKLYHTLKENDLIACDNDGRVWGFLAREGDPFAHPVDITEFVT